MITRKTTFFIGLFITLVPFLGLPTFWKTFLIIFFGVTLILSSIRFNIPRISLKNKLKKEEENFVIPQKDIQGIIKNNSAHVEEVAMVSEELQRKQSKKKTPIRNSSRKKDKNIF